MHKLLKIMKNIKIRNMLILILLLLFNTYAWFIYATRVSGTISVHVSSWNIEFVSADEDLTTNLTVSIDRFFPGMEKFEKVINVHNKGEKKALLNYEIESVKIMDEVITVDEENGPTTEEVTNKLSTQYPFKIKIQKQDGELEEGTGEGKFIITLQWDFESGNDAADTEWGNKAYEYYSIHPNEDSIKINLTLIATQKAE